MKQEWAQTLLAADMKRRREPTQDAPPQLNSPAATERLRAQAETQPRDGEGHFITQREWEKDQRLATQAATISWLLDRVDLYQFERRLLRVELDKKSRLLNQLAAFSVLALVFGIWIGLTH